MIARGVVACACFAAACNSFGDASTTTDGGAVVADAAIDVSDAGDPRPFCERQSPAPFLCDDFDVQPFAFNWTERAEANGGSTENTAGTFIARGGPTVSGQAWAYLRKDVGTTTNEVIVSFSMKNLAVGVGDIEAGGIKVFENGRIPYSASLHITPEGAMSVWEIGQTDAGAEDALQKIPFEKNPNPTQWARLRLHWKISAPAAIRIYVNDDPMPVVDRTLTPTLTTGTRHVLFGATHFEKPGIALEFDDVTIDRR
jgi:hypothetical protein